VDPASQRREVRDALGSMAVRWGQVVSARLGAREMGRASGEGKRENWAELKDIGPRRIHYFVLFFSFLHSLFPNSILNSDLNSNHVANYPQLVL
jgi:hypothetical protein